MEVLIFEGKFQESKALTQEFFRALGSDTAIRAYTDLNDLRVIAAFLNAAAQFLDVGSADRELYLLENVRLGVQLDHLPWSFDEMITYLDKDYGDIKPELSAGDRGTRVEAVKQLINRLKGA
jgi:hypothetical protein